MSGEVTSPSNTSHASEDQHAVNGGSNVRIHLVGTDKPLMTAIALVIAITVGVLSFFQHQSDIAAINEFSQWADLTYTRELKVDAHLAGNGINTEKLFGKIPNPPKRR